MTEPNGLTPLAKEVLEICMLKATKMAEYYAPLAALDPEQEAKHPDEVQFALWLRLARPGERRGGRAKGTPNKFTAHRSALERSGYEGYRLTEPNGLTPLAKEVLEICMLKATKMAEYYAPLAALDPEQEAKHPDEVQFALWLRLAADCANKFGAPFWAARCPGISLKYVSHIGDRAMR